MIVIWKCKRHMCLHSSFQLYLCLCFNFFSCACVCTCFNFCSCPTHYRGKRKGQQFTCMQFIKEANCNLRFFSFAAQNLCVIQMFRQENCNSEFFSFASFFLLKYSYLDVHFNFTGGLKYHIFATQNLCVIQMFRQEI